MANIPLVNGLSVSKLLQAIIEIDPNMQLKDIILWHSEEVESLLVPANFEVYDEIIESLDYYNDFVERSLRNQKWNLKKVPVKVTGTFLFSSL